MAILLVTAIFLLGTAICSFVFFLLLLFFFFFFFFFFWREGLWGCHFEKLLFLGSFKILGIFGVL